MGNTIPGEAKDSSISCVCEEMGCGSRRGVQEQRQHHTTHACVDQKKGLRRQSARLCDQTGKVAALIGCSVSGEVMKPPEPADEHSSARSTFDVRLKISNNHTG